MNRLFIACALLVGCGGSIKEIHVTEAPDRVESHYVQVLMPDGLCSGVAVARDSVHGTTYLTANHCCEGNTDFLARGWNGKEYAAKVVKVDKEHDLCMMDTDENLDARVVRLAGVPPMIGDKLYNMIGAYYVPKHTQPWNEHRFDGVYEGYYIVHPAYIPGDSGGGVYNARGELVSIALAYSGPMGIGASLSQIWDFVYGSP